MTDPKMLCVKLENVYKCDKKYLRTGHRTSLLNLPKPEAEALSSVPSSEVSDVLRGRSVIGLNLNPDEPSTFLETGGLVTFLGFFPFDMLMLRTV